MEKIIAVLAIACLIAFVGIVIGFVVSPDLIIICAIVLVLAVVDFWQQLFPRSSDG